MAEKWLSRLVVLDVLAVNSGHLFVNIAKMRQRRTVTLDTRNAPAKPAYDV